MGASEIIVGMNEPWRAGPQDHPSAAELQAFLGKRDPEVQRRVVRHLLSGCSSCGQRLDALTAASQPRFLRDLERQRSKAPDPTDDYDIVFAHTQEALLHFLSDGGPVEEPPASLLAELADFSRDEQALIRPARRALALLVKWLVSRSHAVRFDDPEKMLQWALMARLAAESCTPAEAGSGARLADLRAKAWAQYGIALKVKGCLHAAEDALTAAQGFLQAGTGNPSLQPWILGRTASLYLDKGNPADASELTGEAMRISAAIGEFDQEATAILLQATALDDQGDYGRAVTLLEQAIDRREFGADFEWLFLARINLVGFYLHVGQVDQAVTLANSIRLMRHPSPTSSAFLHWIWRQGQLQARLGRLEAAESAFRRAHRGFIKKALPRPVAILCQQIVALNREMGYGDRGEQILAESLWFLEKHADPETINSVWKLRNAPESARPNPPKA